MKIQFFFCFYNLKLKSSMEDTVMNDVFNWIKSTLHILIPFTNDHFFMKTYRFDGVIPSTDD